MTRFQSLVAVAAVAIAFSIGAGKAQAQFGGFYIDPNLTSFPVAQSPTVFNGYSFDARTGFVRAYTSGTTVYQSAGDPYRNFADPNSMRYVNEWQRDASGALVNVQGYQWNSAITGQSHGNLTRTRMTPTGTHTEQVFHMRAD